MPGEEKTEEPTAKKRSDAKKEGNVFQSKDAVTVVLLFGMFTVMRFYIPFIYRDVRGFFVHIGALLSVDQPLSKQLFARFVVIAMRDALPLLLTAAALGILGHGVQTRFNISFSPMKPKLSKISPISGVKRLFSLRKLIELLKNLLKITILIYLLYSILKTDIITIARMMQTDLMTSATTLLMMIYNMVLRVAVVFLVIAFFDYLYEKWQYEKDLKMTKQEVKDEYKQTEGNPEIKGRIRNLQRQRSQARMMQEVPKADVVIRNPTHLAIALRYRPDEMRAPVVLAMGMDELALRIVSVAEAHGVATVENKDLARAMYPLCTLNREIPAEFYGAVAEVLVYIYRQQNRDDLLR